MERFADSGCVRALSTLVGLDLVILGLGCTIVTGCEEGYTEDKACRKEVLWALVLPKLRELCEDIYYFN